ncbi:MAG: AzlD domain-containing protein [Halieaceae bacterium]|jgi:branched-subunit amino acid transport protein|nr:AzlD domain-containing protein [Halieaceae bacterium]
MNEWLLILLMALVTFVPRYLPFALAGKVKLSPTLERALSFVPAAVLTAIIAQSTLVRGGELDVSWYNYHAWSALAAFIVAVLTRKLFLTIGVGLSCFVLLKLIFGT